MRKARRIRRKLDADMDLTMPVWHKPKGMHWKTFERLREEAEQADHIQAVEMVKRFGPLREQFADFL